MTVLVIYLATHRPMGAMAGAAVLALLGAKPLLHRGPAPGPVEDERDEAINRRAMLTAYTVLWIALVAWGVVVPLRFGEPGSVPLIWVAPVVWVAWWLVTVAHAVTILVLDGRGA